MSKRDNFSDPTKSALALNVRLQCVKPGCGRATHGPSLTSSNNISIGHAAHASAAAEKGPRFDASLTPEQRRAYENGAWLCASCATLIDRDPDSYPVHVIVGWQRAAEQRAREEMHGTYLRAGVSQGEISQRLGAFLPKAQIHFHFPYHMSAVTVPYKSIETIDWLVYECAGWDPAHPLHSIHDTTVGLQNRLIAALKLISDEVKNFRAWERGHNGYLLIGGGQKDFYLTPEVLQRRNQAFETVKQALLEYRECFDLLTEYKRGVRR